MLAKRIDQNSIPLGTYTLHEDIIKGSAVFLNSDDELALPTSEAEAQAVLGLVTFRIEYKEGKDSDYETLEAGKRVVCYTLEKHNVWATTQHTGTIAKGDSLVVDYSETKKGMLRALSADEVTAKRVAQFKCVRAAYTIGDFTFIDVEVL
jgi:hypothetical protein